MGPNRQRRARSPSTKTKNTFNTTGPKPQKAQIPELFLSHAQRKVIRNALSSQLTSGMEMDKDKDKGKGKGKGKGKEIRVARIDDDEDDVEEEEVEIRRPQRPTSASNSKIYPVTAINKIRIGQQCQIILKRDQGTTNLTPGIVAELLTRGDHPRGVKVRLQDGQVGRVHQGGNVKRNANVDVGAEYGRQTQQTDQVPVKITIVNKATSESSQHKEQKTFNMGALASEVSQVDASGRIQSKASAGVRNTSLPNFLRLLESNKNYQRYLAKREQLPAYAMKKEIMNQINNNQVVVLEGDTGCGKSTQIPQFILNDAYENSKEVKILVSQPRRLAAIALAQRVSAERSGQHTVGDEVGFSIRMNNQTSKNTRLTFMTTGILLKILEASALDGVTHIIIDEVHERSCESDFLLMALRILAQSNRSIKIVLMSATINAELFSNYFSGAPRLKIPGRTFPVETLYLEDAIQNTRFDPGGSIRQQGNQRPRNVPLETIPDQELNTSELSARYSAYGPKVISSLQRMNMEEINYKLITTLVIWILKSLQDAPYRCILIFLPGTYEIHSLQSTLLREQSVRNATSNGGYLLQLHGSLNPDEQLKIFEDVPKHVTKIILATNIAEASITVDDCVYVIDSGRHKETRYDAMKGMSSLEECWISQANAKQRRGRAGRVQSGTCIHLFTKHKHDVFMDKQQTPEIQRAPLEQLCLIMKTLPFLKGSIFQIFDQVIEPPATEAITRAIMNLRAVQAITKEEKLTSLGLHLSRLPVDVRIGKLLVFGCIFGCLDATLSIAAGISSKSPFLSPMDKRDVAMTRKLNLAIADSDHITLVAAYNTWQKVRLNWNAQKKFCEDNFISGRTMTQMMGIRRQLVELLSDIGFIKSGIKIRDIERLQNPDNDGVALAIGEDTKRSLESQLPMIKGCLVASLWPNVTKIVRPLKAADKYRFESREDQELTLHPSSVVSKIATFPIGYLCYLEKVKTSRMFIRDSTVVNSIALALFGGKLTFDASQGILNVDDGWIRFSADVANASAIESVRTALDELLSRKLVEPDLDIAHTKIISAISEILTD